MTRSHLPPGWPTRRIELAVADQTLTLTVPQDPYAMLDLPAIEEAFRADEYMPYWAYLWPAGIMLGEWLLRTAADAAAAARLGLPAPPAGALEIGCGLGVCGLLAARAGYRVTCSDYDADALDYVRANARANRLAVEATLIDWRNPPGGRYPLLLAADCLYEQRHHEAVLEFFRLSLAAGGLAAMSDPNRRLADAFLRLARDGAWQVAVEPARWAESAGRIILLRRAPTTRQAH